MSKNVARSLKSPRLTVLTIRVTPRACKNQITQVMSDGTIKISLTAPPVEGKANISLIKFLAEILQIPVASIEITAGASGRNKIVSIAGLEADVAHQRIANSISK
jgi:hypothetical protein